MSQVVNESTGHTASADNEWQSRPPYAVQPPELFGKAYWHASCQCGRVRYQVNREKPLDAKFCHCRGCQLLHGAPFQWAAIFEKSNITFTAGHDSLEFYDSARKVQEHILPCKVSCGFCHSPIMDEGRRMALIFPELLDLNDEGRLLFAPSCHIFYSQRVVDMPDGKPKWTGINDSSALMDEP